MSTKKLVSKPRRPSAKKSYAKVVEENKDLKRNLDESLERETATSEILRMIARSPTDLQPVLDAIAERAANLCDAEDAAIFRVDGNFLRLLRTSARFLWQKLWVRASSWIATRPWVEQH